MTSEQPRTGGGAATSAGTTFQEDVACYLSTLILAESSAEPLAALPADVLPTSIVAETKQPIDDLLVSTSAGGCLYFQVKTALNLSDNPNSEFAKTIGQFVRQRLLGARPIASPARSLDAIRDRFILTVGHGASARITDVLASVLTKCRHVAGDQGLSTIENSLSSEEKRALSETRGHIHTNWMAVTGAAPPAHDELSILHLMHVLQLDLREGQAAFVSARNLLRQFVLTDQSRVDDAWNALISICRAFGPQRTGGDLAYLRAELQRRKIPIRSVPSFKDDIEALRKYTADRLTFLSRLSFIELSGQSIKITRDVTRAVLDFAAADHTAVIGEPGAGKSGCVHDVADQLISEHKDVVLLAADMIDASSPEALAGHLGLSKLRGLVDVLQNWSGEDTAFLIIDALDAARSGMSLYILCQILRDVRERAPRWHIVASIREYDLRTSPDVQDLFQGKPHPQFYDSRFATVRHVRIDRLSIAELTQVTDAQPSISEALSNAASLGELSRNPFNLSLLCKLLDSQVSNAELSAVQTQVGLLDLYWSRRVEAQDRTSRRRVLGAAVDLMISDRALHLSRLLLEKSLAGNEVTLEKLLSDGVLIELPPRPKAAPVIAFAHNILFDFAVCRLWLDGLSDPAVKKLSEPANQDLLLAIRPSIAMAFEELWFEDKSRAVYWERAIALEEAPGMRLIGRIIAAGVAAQQYRTIADAMPLVKLLRQQKVSAVAQLRFMIQSAIAQQESAPDRPKLSGEGAAEWMTLAAELRGDLDQVAWEVRSLIWPMTQGRIKATDVQASHANNAAVALLHFGLSDPRHSNMVRPALDVAASTIASNPDATANALAEVLSEDNLAVGAHEWLHPIAEQIDVIARVKPELALRIVEIAFGVTGDRNSAVTFGGRILAFSMNKHDLVSMARHDIQQKYSQVWKQDPVTAVRMSIRVLAARTKEEDSRLIDLKKMHRFHFRGKSATLVADNCHYWTAGEYNHHEEWYKILTALENGLCELAKEGAGAIRLEAVLDVLRDEAIHAVNWRAVLEAGAKEPATLGPSISELLASPAILRQAELREAAGDLIECGFEHFSMERRLEIENAILRIPEGSTKEALEFAETRRNRLIGCVPVHLIQMPALRKIRAELDANGGPPPNLPEVSITSSWSGPDDDHWRLRRQGVKPERPENEALMRASRALKAIPGENAKGRPSLSSADDSLALLRDVESALDAGRQNGADPPLIRQVDAEMIQACNHLARTEGLKRDLPLAVFIRATLRRGAIDQRPRFNEEDDKQWDKESAAWGSPSPRIDAAMGLMWLAVNSDTVDSEILKDVALLAEDRVSAVRFQILAHCIWLHHTASDLMWCLIERTCISEPRTAVLNFFCSNVVFQIPVQDYTRLEPLVRVLFQRTRRIESMRPIRRHCGIFYAKAALWRNERRASRYIQVFAHRPQVFTDESNTVIGFCRNLIRFRDTDNLTAAQHARGWAFEFLTSVVKAVLQRATHLKEKHTDESFDSWPELDIEELKKLHQIAHNVATTVYIGSGAADERRNSPVEPEDLPASNDEKRLILREGRELFNSLCNIEFVESAYDVLRTLEYLVDADHSEIILRIAALVRRAERDGIQYESMAAERVVNIIERYLSEFGSLFRRDSEARAALLDILDVFVGAGWPGATRLTYRLGEVFR